MTNSSATSKILITGGAGFIGTHIARALVNNHQQVVVLDLKQPEFSVDKVEYKLGDMKNEELLKSSLSGVTGVVYLASLECDGTELMLESIYNEMNRADSVIPVLFASSCAIYGQQPLGVPISETSEPSPISPYAQEKLKSEGIFKDFYEKCGVPSLLMRMFNVYGPDQSIQSLYAGVITKSLHALRSGQKLKIFGDGSATRDFIHVTDIAQAYVKALTLDPKNLGVKAINLGSGTSVTVKQMTELICACEGKTPSSDWIEYAEERPFDIQHSVADNHLAKTFLGWSPTIEFEQGLKSLCSGFSCK